MIIVVTGIDGCGKTSVAEQLHAHLVGLGKEVTAAVSPDRSTPTGIAIESYLKLPMDQRDPVALQALFVTNRIEQLDLFREHAGNPNKHLIMSRYWESGLVYGAAEGIPFEWLIQTQTLTPAADFWFFLDISVEESFSRRPDRRDHYELDKRFLKDVRGKFLNLFLAPPGGGRCIILDGSQPVHKSVNDIVNTVL